MGIFRTRHFIFAINAYLATALALYVAFALDLPNPWWAMVTVFLAQPTQLLVGAIWAKAAYRIVGTDRVAVSLLIIPNLSQAPALMVLALAGWIGLAFSARYLIARRVLCLPACSIYGGAGRPAAGDRPDWALRHQRRPRRRNRHRRARVRNRPEHPVSAQRHSFHAGQAERNPRRCADGDRRGARGASLLGPTLATSISRQA